jgi:genome maintenance exonuclease 1
MDKKALVAWKKRVGPAKAAKISKEATDRGTSLHKIIESYVMNEPLDFLNNAISKARFLKVKDPLDRLTNIRLVETSLYSDELGLAGTPDIIADYINKLAVVDAKTSTRAKKKEWIVSYFLQAACYGVMYEELFKEPVELAVIIMSTEALQQPQVFIEPMKGCIGMLRNFMKDPELFQKRMEMYKP